MAVIEQSGADVDQTETDLGATLSWYRHGASDPTTWLDRTGRGVNSSGRFVRGTWTPDGPATVALHWGPGRSVDAQTWGPGGDWLMATVPGLIGDLDSGAPHLETDSHPLVAAACRARRNVKHSRSGTLYHELLPNIIEQRITAGEATKQWARLCFELGQAAPGPFTRLSLPPGPDVLRSQPSWWFHPLGIERKRVEPLTQIATHADKLWAWADLEPSETARLLRLLRGIGVWTTGVACGPALGDTDSVPVGDFHIKNIIGFNLAGEARATDERMLELLEPYEGQRGRVVRAVCSYGGGAPKFGPRKRILPMARW